MVLVWATFGVNLVNLLDLVEAWYSLNSTLVEGRQASSTTVTSSGLKGTWKLSTYIGLVSLRCAKTVKTGNN